MSPDSTRSAAPFVHGALLKKLDDRTAHIGILGLGYVGLPLMLRFSEVGYKVTGFDIDQAKVDKLNNAQSYIERITPQIIRGALDRGFVATSDFARAKDMDALIICVPTPLNKYREPDLSFVIDTTKSVVPHMRKGQVLSLESTTYPGTTEEELRPLVEGAGLTIGVDAFLVFSPEREDPSNPDYETRTIPKVVGGSTPACLQAGLALYRQAIDKLVPVSSTQTAEMTKLLENIHRAVNIGLANEMKIVCDRMGVDVYEVIRAAATKPFGFVPYYPGPGLGGHCIPIDPFYLTWKAREYGVHTKFIELAGEINSSMPAWVVAKVADALNDRGKALRGAKVLVLGLAYKKNVDDPRESPSIEMMELLRVKGAEIAYSDPHIPAFPKMREHHFDLKSIALSPSSLSGFDCALLATNHDAFDFELIKKHAPLVVDTRGVYKEPAANVVRA
jgi:UDP-N-acetyl-D-glucosamine dehydrogenase